MKKLCALAFVVTTGLAGCGTLQTESFTDYQNRAVSLIQAAQKTYTARLAAHEITVEEDQSMQAKLLVARRQVIAARTTADILSATQPVGIQP